MKFAKYDSRNPEIFISYAREGASLHVTEALDQFFQENGITIVRDTREIGYKGLINAYIQRLGRGKYVVVVLSDAYFTSKRCMHELLLLSEHQDFYDRIFPVIVEGTNIDEPEDILKFTTYWEEKITALDTMMRDTKSLANLQGIQDDLDRYTQIRQNIPRLLDFLRNINTRPLEGSHFEPLYQAIQTRIEQDRREKIAALKKNVLRLCCACSLALALLGFGIFGVQPLLFPQFPEITKIVKHSPDGSVNIQLQEHDAFQVFLDDKLILDDPKLLAFRNRTIEEKLTVPKGATAHELQFIGGLLNTTHTVLLEATYYPNWEILQFPDPRLKPMMLEIQERDIILKDISNNASWQTFSGHQAPVTVALWAANFQVFSGSEDSTIKHWNVSPNQELATFRGHRGAVRSLDVFSGTKSIVSGGDDATIRIWDIEWNDNELVCQGHSGPVLSVAFSPNGEHILSGGQDRMIRLWNRKCHLIKEWEGHAGPVLRAIFSPDGQKILSASTDYTIKLWDMQGSLRGTWKEHQAPVKSLEFSRDGSLMVSGSTDGIIHIWNVASGQPAVTLSAYNDKADQDEVRKAWISRDNELVLWQGMRGTMKVWRLSTQKHMNILFGHKGGIMCARFSPDGQYAISGGKDQRVVLWDLATGDMVRHFTGHTESINSVAFSPDGKTILSGSADHSITLWDIETEEIIWSAKQHAKSVRSVAFSPDGTKVISGGEDAAIRLWDSQTGESLWDVYYADPQPVDSTVFSPDGRMILAASGDRILLWDIETQKQSGQFIGHQETVTSVAFSPDGKRILSGSADTTIKLWEAATGRLLRTFSGHTGEVTSVAFSRDGLTCLSGSQDKTMKLWEVATGKTLRTFSGHRHWVNSVAFFPHDNSALSGSALSGSADSMMKLWWAGRETIIE